MLSYDLCLVISILLKSVESKLMTFVHQCQWFWLFAILNSWLMRFSKVNRVDIWLDHRSWKLGVAIELGACRCVQLILCISKVPRLLCIECLALTLGQLPPLIEAQRPCSPSELDSCRRSVEINLFLRWGPNILDVPLWADILTWSDKLTLVSVEIYPKLLGGFHYNTNKIK